MVYFYSSLIFFLSCFYRANSSLLSVITFLLVFYTYFAHECSLLIASFATYKNSVLFVTYYRIRRDTELLNEQWQVFLYKEWALFSLLIVAQWHF